MKIGVIYPQMELGKGPDCTRDYAQAVEELGYSFISTYEHIVGGNSNQPDWDKPFDYSTPFHEPFVMFGFMAGCTKMIGFMTRILILSQRQTVLVAKQAATLDVLCGGRLRLGVGIGWNEVEYISQGENFHNRGERIEEQVILLRKLWTCSLVSYESNWHTIPDVGINPLPAQRPIPIWIGGHSDVALRRVARLGDGWLPNDLSFPDTKSAIQKLKHYIVEEGRPITDIGIDPRLSYGEGVQNSWRIKIQDWKALGATHLSIDTMGFGFSSIDDHLKALETFAKEINLNVWL